MDYEAEDRNALLCAELALESMTRAMTLSEVAAALGLDDPGSTGAADEARRICAHWGIIASDDTQSHRE